jgi:PleD family two-component response regulator
LAESQVGQGTTFLFSIKTQGEPALKLTNILLQTETITEEKSLSEQNFPSMMMPGLSFTDILKQKLISRFKQMTSSDDSPSSPKLSPLNSESTLCTCSELPAVLVVDDNAFNVFTIQTVLQGLGGVKSDSALHGKQAVEFVEQRL